MTLHSFTYMHVYSAYGAMLTLHFLPGVPLGPGIPFNPGFP